MGLVSGTVEEAVAEAFRESWAQIVATLIGSTGDWDLAEECAQDAFTAAVEAWTLRGVPERPGAWLTSVARNRVTDVLRRRSLGAEKFKEVALAERDKDVVVTEPIDLDEVAMSGVHDDRLRLIFTCCHPALPLDAQVALTLRALVGLSTAEIARAFLVPERTMAQRLVRAKRKIHNAGIPYRIPPRRLLGQRVEAVLGVIYLLFNEGYSASSGADVVRRGLTGEALRLVSLLTTLMPEDCEVAGLQALMLMHDARSAARLDETGDLVPLEEQDRTRWDMGKIAEAVDILKGAMQKARPGPYQIQAAIVACHAAAGDVSHTDWSQIAALYQRLNDLTPSPVVELNRAVAVAMAYGPTAGLAIVDSLVESRSLASYHLLHAVRADLLDRLQRFDEAAGCYREAFNLANTDSERRFLARRLMEIAERGTHSSSS
ncbi:MAG: polymerase ECF-subfamily sigma factor [Acidimicrobiaceae bacterium]|nr:polymerase ECF-subfamily sigma factor [Acidimicrobiaceae bacterium]